MKLNLRKEKGITLVALIVTKLVQVAWNKGLKAILSIVCILATALYRVLRAFPC